MARGAKQQKQIVLKRIEDESLEIEIEGLTPLIPHKWSEKSLRQMREKQGIEAAPTPGKKEPKNPKEEAEASLYRTANGSPGMPAVAFKGAIVDGCRFFDAISMEFAKRCIYVEGEGVEQLVEVTGELTMREDTPRNDNGNPDLRYRYAIFPWKATLVVRYPKRMMTAESVLAITDAAGRNGVGDWRPGSPKSKTGTYGTFRVRI